MVHENIHYVYIHIRSDNNEPFYIGIGKDRRAWTFGRTARSPEWRSVYLNHGVDVVIYEHSLSPNEAMDIEKELISDYRDAGYDLVNKSSGGQYGSSGVIRSRETRMKLRDINGGHEVYCSNGMKFESFKDAARWLISEGVDKASNSGISSVCRGGCVTAYGYAWSKDSVPDMPSIFSHELTAKVNKETRGVKLYTCMGELFDSMHSAAKAMRSAGYSRASRTAIKKVISGAQPHVYGRVWSTVGFPDRLDEYTFSGNRGTMESKFGKPVCTSCGLSFNTITRAVEWLRSNGYPKANKGAIISSAKNTDRTAYGRKWEYSEVVPTQEEEGY